MGWLHPGQPVWLEGALCAGLVGSGSLELVGKAMAGHLPSEWTAEGVVWQGVSASVFVSESGSCVCLWSPAFLGFGF